MPNICCRLSVFRWPSLSIRHRKPAFAAAAIQGAIAGATIGFAVVVLTIREPLSPATAIRIAVLGALGFAIAEAIVQWLARRRESKADV